MDEQELGDAPAADGRDAEVTRLKTRLESYERIFENMRRKLHQARRVRPAMATDLDAGPLDAPADLDASLAADAAEQLGRQVEALKAQNEELRDRLVKLRDANKAAAAKAQERIEGLQTRLGDFREREEALKERLLAERELRKSADEGADEAADV